METIKKNYFAIDFHENIATKFFNVLIFLTLNEFTANSGFKGQATRFLLAIFEKNINYNKTYV